MPSRADEPLSAPRAWRSLPIRLVLAALPAWLTLSLLVFHVGWTTKLLVAAVLAVSLADPEAGLLVTALVAPLGYLIAPLFGPLNFRIGEAVVLAFLTGWLLRGGHDRRGPRVAAPAAGWLFVAVIAASVAGLALGLRASPGALTAAIDEQLHAHYLIVGDAIGFVDAARLLEGVALVAATVMLIRRRPRLTVTLPAALAASAAIATMSSVLLWRGIGWAAAIARYDRIGYRVSAHVADVNASGSYFAMMTCLALGMTLRARGRARGAWIGLTLAAAVGLWFSESRSALGAAGAVIAIAAAWAATRRFPVRARAVTLIVIVVAALGAGAVRARLLEKDPTYRGAGFRTQFNETSARMIAARPLFGVGVGQYYRTSTLFLAPQLAFSYGLENAHNNFLQIGAELGLVGLGLFIVWIGAPIVRGVRAIVRVPRDGRLLGATAGVAAFAATGLFGHPLLVSEVAFPFWIVLGLVTALAGSQLFPAGEPARAGRPWPAIAAALAIVLASTAIAATRTLTPSDARAVNGLWDWQTLADGTRFRWTGAYASLFVPADVTRVYVPVRLPVDGRSLQPMGVEVMATGADRGRTLVTDGWQELEIPLPDVGLPYKRIDLKVDRTWQPALYIAGSGDFRVVGIQVGEPRLVRQ